MPKVSKDSAAQVTDHGAAEDRTGGARRILGQLVAADALLGAGLADQHLGQRSRGTHRPLGGPLPQGEERAVSSQVASPLGDRTGVMTRCADRPCSPDGGAQWRVPRTDVPIGTALTVRCRNDDRFPMAHGAGGDLSWAYQRAWTSVPLCSVETFFALLLHSIKAPRSCQVSTACFQCSTTPAGDS